MSSSGILLPTVPLAHVPSCVTVAEKLDSEMLPISLTGLAESHFDAFQARLVATFPEAVLGNMEPNSSNVFIECERSKSIKKKERVRLTSHCAYCAYCTCAIDWIA